MARTKQTARKSTGGKAARGALITTVMSRGKGGCGIGKGGCGIGKGGGKRARFSAPACDCDDDDDDAPVFASSIFGTVGSGSSAEEPEAKEITYQITHESSFYKHFFNTGGQTTEDFLPRFLGATIENPLNGEKEQWLALLLNSKFDGDVAARERPLLNMSIAIDISGSMGIPFSGETGQTKLQVARTALLSLGEQLKDDDVFSLVAFNEKSFVVIPPSKWSSIGMAKLKSAVQALRPSGGTDISQAMTKALSLIEKEAGSASSRILCLTDMEVSTSDGQAFSTMVHDLASKRSIWSTVVGVGLDLGSEVIASVSKALGCNYASVATSKDFKDLASREFGHWVTPVAFNGLLTVEGARILSGFGSPEAAAAEPEQVRFITEFPSLKNDKGETRSGLVIFKVATKDTSKAAKVKMVWENSSGIKSDRSEDVEFPEAPPPESPLRKAVLLVHYTAFLMQYLALRGKENGSQKELDEFLHLRKQFPKLVTHMVAETDVIPDETLTDELTVLLEIAKDDDIPVPAIGKRKEPEAPAAPADGSATTGASAPAPSEASAPPAKEAKLAFKISEEVLTKADRKTLQEIAKLAGVPANLKTSELVSRCRDTEVTSPASDCCVCMAAPKGVVLLPCRHACVCKACSPSLTTCPLCREKIESSLTIFL